MTDDNKFRLGDLIARPQLTPPNTIEFRQATVNSVTVGASTITASITFATGVTGTEVTCMSDIQPVVGEGVWVAVMGQGRMLIVGTCKYAGARTIYGTLALTGALTIAYAGGGSKINLTGATSNWIDFGTNGQGAPTFTARSDGTKVLVNNELSGSLAGYAIGYLTDVMWFGVSTTAKSFRWYGGTTLAATLTGLGALSIVGSLTVSGTLVSAAGLALIDDADATAQLATLGAGKKCQVDLYTSGSTTWTKPAGAKAHEVHVIGGGGGAGAGRRGPTANTRNGGGGGQGGGRSVQTFIAADIPATVNCTVGGGGAGAVGQVTNATDGANGTSGGDSFFGASAATNLCQAWGGQAGEGGSQGLAAGNEGSGGGTWAFGGGYALFGGGNGGPSIVGAAGAGAQNVATGAGGGGGGGSISNGNVDAAGGGGSWPISQFGRTGSTVGAAGGGTAGAGGTLGVTNGTPAGGCGGGGGGARATGGVGGTGGPGGLYGGGGGGGGASLDGNNSGAGGAGAAGCVVVITWF